MTYTDEHIDERIRASAARENDADWGDVRRRARRKRRPLALVAGVALAAVLAAPAFALREQLGDLWDTAEPERNLYVRASADCGIGDFTLDFDPVNGASVGQGGQTLASATHTERTIECDAPIQSFKGEPDSSPWRGELDKRSYSTVSLACATNVALQVGVNPIWETGASGSSDETRIAGSTMVVADRHTRTIIASAVLVRDRRGRNWSRTYWASAYCSAPNGYDPTVPPGAEGSGG